MSPHPSPSWCKSQLWFEWSKKISRERTIELPSQNVIWDIGDFRCCAIRRRLSILWITVTRNSSKDARLGCGTNSPVLWKDNRMSKAAGQRRYTKFIFSSSWKKTPEGSKMSRSDLSAYRKGFGDLLMAMSSSKNLAWLIVPLSNLWYMASMWPKTRVPWSWRKYSWERKKSSCFCSLFALVPRRENSLSTRRIIRAWPFEWWSSFSRHLDSVLPPSRGEEQASKAPGKFLQSAPESWHGGSKPVLTFINNQIELRLCELSVRRTVEYLWKAGAQRDTLPLLEIRPEVVVIARMETFIVWTQGHMVHRMPEGDAVFSKRLSQGSLSRSRRGTQKNQALG